LILSPQLAIRFFTRASFFTFSYSQAVDSCVRFYRALPTTRHAQRQDQLR
jgi:hypothetical protein